MMNTKDHKNTNKSNALREPSLISLYIYIYIYITNNDSFMLRNITHPPGELEI